MSNETIWMKPYDAHVICGSKMQSDPGDPIEWKVVRVVSPYIIYPGQTFLLAVNTMNKITAGLKLKSYKNSQWN